MTDTRAIVERSRRHHLQETAGSTIYIPGQTIGHHGGGGGTSLLKAYCKEDAGDSNSITCFLSYPELNVRVWNAATTYIAGHIVTHNNKFWVSLNATNLNHEPAEDAYWTEILAYDEANEYSADEYCLYDSKLWRCKATTTGDIPEEGTYWTTKAKAYAAGTAYVIDDRVTYDSKVYRCIQAGTGKTPDTETTYWTELAEIEVFCNIAGGNALQFAFPLLAEQQCLKVELVDGRYEAIQLFQAAEENCAEGGMLELVSETLAYDCVTTATSMWADAHQSGLGLRFAAQANSIYTIEFSILYSAPTTADGIKVGVNGPAGFTSVSGVFYGQDGTTFVGKVFNDYQVESLFPNNVAGANFIRGECVFVNGDTAGEFTLQFLSETGAAVTVKVGSNIKYRRLYRIPAE